MLRGGGKSHHMPTLTFITSFDTIDICYKISYNINVDIKDHQIAYKYSKLQALKTIIDTNSSPQIANIYGLVDSHAGMLIE